MLWKKNMQLIDANVIIRCILDDCPEMTAKATEVIDSEWCIYKTRNHCRSCVCAPESIFCTTWSIEENDL